MLDHDRAHIAAALLSARETTDKFKLGKPIAPGEIDVLDAKLRRAIEAVDSPSR
jgi:hypothetical protein